MLLAALDRAVSGVGTFVADVGAEGCAVPAFLFIGFVFHRSVAGRTLRDLAFSRELEGVKAELGFLHHVEFFCRSKSSLKEGATSSTGSSSRICSRKRPAHESSRNLRRFGPKWDQGSNLSACGMHRQASRPVCGFYKFLKIFAL